MITKFSFIHFICPPARKEPISSLLHFLSLRLKFIVTEVWWRGLLSGYLALTTFLFQLLRSCYYQYSNSKVEQHYYFASQMLKVRTTTSDCQLSSEYWVYSLMFMLLSFAALSTNTSIPADLSLLLNSSKVLILGIQESIPRVSVYGQGFLPPQYSYQSQFIVQNMLAVAGVYCPAYIHHCSSISKISHASLYILQPIHMSQARYSLLANFKE